MLFRLCWDGLLMGHFVLVELTEQPEITGNRISVVRLDELWKQHFQVDIPECSQDEQLGPSRENVSVHGNG